MRHAVYKYVALMDKAGQVERSEIRTGTLENIFNHSLVFVLSILLCINLKYTTMLVVSVAG